MDIERHYNELPPLLQDSVAWQQFQAFLRDHPTLEPYRTEWRLFDADFLVTGTIDFAYVSRRDAEGRVVAVSLIDWKSCKVGAVRSALAAADAVGHPQHGLCAQEL